MTEQNEKESIKWYDNILMVMVGSVPVLCSLYESSVCVPVYSIRQYSLRR